MRKLKVRHEPLPGIGELFEIVVASGLCGARREPTVRPTGSVDRLT